MTDNINILQNRGLVLQFMKEQLFLGEETARSYATIMQKILVQPLYTFNNRQSGAIRVIKIFEKFIDYIKENNVVSEEEYKLLYRQLIQMKFNRDVEIGD